MIFASDISPIRLIVASNALLGYEKAELWARGRFVLLSAERGKPERSKTCVCRKLSWGVTDSNSVYMSHHSHPSVLKQTARLAPLVFPFPPLFVARPSHTFRDERHTTLFRRC